MMLSKLPSLKSLITLSILTPMAFAQEVKLPGGIIQIGQINQGQTVDIEVPVYNNTPKPLIIEDIIPQGIGPKDIEHPKSIKKGETGMVKFRYDSKYLKGQIKEHVTLILANNQQFPMVLEGIVNEQIFFNEATVDMGFVDANSQAKEIYVWGDSPAAFDLKVVNNPLIKATLVPVYLDIRNTDKVKEVSKSQKYAYAGYKVQLKANSSKIKKSLSTLLAFQSTKYKLATPEVHVVGYKK